MKHFVFTCIRLLTIVCVGVAPCNAEGPTPFTVGMLLPLSGPLADMGGAFRRGVELYLAEHPAAKVSFVYEDHKYDAKTAVTGLHALRSRTDINLVLVWGNTPAGAVAPVAEQQRIPTLTISMNPDARNRRYVVSLGPPVDDLVNVIVDRFKRFGTGHAGAVSIDVGNALQAIDLVDNALGGQMVKKVVSGDELDFKPIILQLRSREVERLVVFLLPQQALTFLRQAKQLKYTPHIVGGDVFAVESFQNEAHQLSSTVGFAYGSVRDQFLKRLAGAAQGTSYFFEVATGYSVAAMVDEVAQIRSSGNATGDILTTLCALRPSNLPLESVTFKETPEFGRHFAVGSRYYPVPLSLGDG